MQSSNINLIYTINLGMKVWIPLAHAECFEIKFNIGLTSKKTLFEINFCLMNHPLQ